VGLAHAQDTLLPKLELADETAGGAVDAHDATVVHIYLADDQVVDARHHLPSNPSTPTDLSGLFQPSCAHALTDNTCDSEVTARLGCS
jgi:hypothetical protein